MVGAPLVWLTALVIILQVVYRLQGRPVGRARWAKLLPLEVVPSGCRSFCLDSDAGHLPTFHTDAMGMVPYQSSYVVKVSDYVAYHYERLFRFLHFVLLLFADCSATTFYQAFFHGFGLAWQKPWSSFTKVLVKKNLGAKW